MAWRIQKWKTPVEILATWQSKGKLLINMTRVVRWTTLNRDQHWEKILGAAGGCPGNAMWWFFSVLKLCCSEWWKFLLLCSTTFVFQRVLLQILSSLGVFQRLVDVLFGSVFCSSTSCLPVKCSDASALQAAALSCAPAARHSWASQAWVTLVRQLL